MYKLYSHRRWLGQRIWLYTYLYSRRFWLYTTWFVDNFGCITFVLRTNFDCITHPWISWIQPSIVATQSHTLKPIGCIIPVKRRHVGCIARLCMCRRDHLAARYITLYNICNVNVWYHGLYIVLYPPYVMHCRVLASILLLVVLYNPMLESRTTHAMVRCFPWWKRTRLRDVGHPCATDAPILLCIVVYVPYVPHAWDTWVTRVETSKTCTL